MSRMERVSYRTGLVGRVGEAARLLKITSMTSPGYAG